MANHPPAPRHRQGYYNAANPSGAATTNPAVRRAQD
jgi:hypothetical protein